MFTLIAIGTGAAWLYSLFATLAPDAFLRHSANRMVQSLSI